MAKRVEFEFYDAARIEARRNGSEPLAKPKHEPFVHPCDECGDPNAPFGEGVSLLKGITGVWLCSRHAPLHLKHPGAAPNAP